MCGQESRVKIQVFVWYFESQDPQSSLSIPNSIHYPLNTMGPLSIQLVRHINIAVPNIWYLLCTLRLSAPFGLLGNLPLFVMIFLAVWTSMGDQGYESLTKCDDLPNIPSQSHYTSTIIISPWRKQGKTVKPCKVCRCIPWIPMIIIWLVPLIVPLFPQSWPIVSPIPGKINNFTVFPRWNDD